MPRGMTEPELSQLGRLGAHSMAHRGSVHDPDRDGQTMLLRSVVLRGFREHDRR
jgi:hypothetical protein